MRSGACLAVAFATALGPLLTSASADEDLQLGIRQFRDGDLQAAVVTLDRTVARLRAQPEARTEDRVQALVYRGAALVGLAQEEPAKASFREALRLDPQRRLSETEFSRRVVRVFDAARAGRADSVLAPSSGSGKKIAIGGIAIAAIGAGVALAGGGGGGGTTTSSGSTTTPITPATQPLATAVTPLGASRGNFTLEFVSVQPAPGSTVSGFDGTLAFGATFKLALQVSNPTGVDATGCVCYVWLHPESGNCLQSAGSFDVAAGRGTQVVVGTPLPAHNCPTPIQIRSMEAYTYCVTGPETTFRGFLQHGGSDRAWSISYQINP